MHVTAAVIDVKIFCLRVVPNGVRILQEFHCGEQLIRLSVENLEVAGLAIGNVNSIEVLAIKHRVRFFDSCDGVNRFATLQFKDTHRLRTFGRGKQPIAFEVDAKMIKLPRRIGGKRYSLGQLKWRGVLSSRWNRN